MNDVTGSSKERVSDTELRIMIQGLEAIDKKARSIDQNWKLSALRELLERRASLEPPAEHWCEGCGAVLQQSFCPVHGKMRPVKPPLPEWRPIATAPKDGSLILTVVTGWQPGIYKWFAFEEGGGRWTPDPECFLEEAHLGEWIDGNSYDPTHWMPIPKGPTATKAGEQA